MATPCRYITRPALANEREQTNAAGEVVLKLNTPWRNGTTYLVMSPLEFMQRNVERPLCGSQTHRRSGSSGSPAGSREPDLDPVDLPDETDCQTSDMRRPQWSSVNRRRSRVRSDEPLGAPLH